MGNRISADLRRLIDCLQGLELTNKEKLFIAHYIEAHYNGTEAYIKAGFTVKNRETASSQASALLRKATIVEGLHTYIASVLGPMQESLKKQLFERWFVQAFYSVDMFVKPDGTPAFTSWEEIPEKYRCCIENIERKYYGRDASQSSVIIKMVDQKFYQDKLDKFIQMTKESRLLEVSEITDEEKKRLASMFPGGKKEVKDAKRE